MAGKSQRDDMSPAHITVFLSQVKNFTKHGIIRPAIVFLSVEDPQRPSILGMEYAVKSCFLLPPSLMGDLGGVGAPKKITRRKPEGTDLTGRKQIVHPPDGKFFYWSAKQLIHPRV